MRTYADTCVMCLLQGLVAGLRAVVIDRFDGDAQEACDVFGARDAEFDEGIDTQFGGEVLGVGVDAELFFGGQGGVEVFDKGREEGEERLVEMLVELAQGFINEFVGFNEVEHLFGAFGECGTAQCFLVLCHGLDDVGALGHVACNVGISDAVGDGELVVECGELSIECGELGVECGQLGVALLCDEVEFSISLYEYEQDDD